MAPTAVETLIIMTSSTAMTPLTYSIYNISSIFFVDDTQAYNAVDIVLSKVTSIDSWCI
jgi:hypothetical protein